MADTITLPTPTIGQNWLTPDPARHPSRLIVCIDEIHDTRIIGFRRRGVSSMHYARAERFLTWARRSGAVPMLNTGT